MKFLARFAGAMAIITIFVLVLSYEASLTHSKPYRIHHKQAGYIAAL